MLKYKVLIGLLIGLLFVGPVYAGIEGVGMAVKSINEAVTHGGLNGADYQPVLGYNNDVGTTLEDVTELGVNVTPVPGGTTDTPIALEIVSSSVNDDVGGTGAITVEVHTLIAGFQEKIETITMDGTDAVALPSTYLRVNNMHTRTTGSGGVAAGDITVQSVGGGTVYNKISTGGNMSLQAFFTIPASDVDGNAYEWGYVVGWKPGIVTSKKDTIARAILRTTSDWHNDELIAGVFLYRDIATAQTTSVYIPIFLRLAVMSDIKISAQELDGTGNTFVTGSIFLYYK